MPIFIAFAAFLLLIFAPRLGLHIGPWVVPTGPFAPKRKSPGQKSGVRTAMLEMMLDHDSGRMGGRCLKGRFAGRELSPLDDGELFQLLDELRAADSQGATLLEAFLDRRSHDWRDRYADYRAKCDPRPTHAHTMTIDETYAVLGLRLGATTDEIRAAHRKLMMKFHPDQGGSTYLATHINEAKEILLARE